MNEAFLWFLHGIGCFVLGWGACRIWIAVSSQHADEIDRLRDANARLRALARLKAYQEMHEDGKEHE